VHVDVDDGALAAGVQHLEHRHLDRARLELHALAPAYPGVGAAALDLHRRHRRRDLLDPAGQRGDRARDVVVGQARGVRAGEDLPLGVVGEGRLAEADGRVVALVGHRQVPEQARRAVDADDEHARRHRVQRAGVTDLAGTGEPPQPGHHVVRGAPGRLVDDDDSRRRRLLSRHGNRDRVGLRLPARGHDRVSSPGSSRSASWSSRR
jgi:hypothetical protein